LINNKKFWNEFYKKKLSVLKPSPFARFVYSKLNKKKNISVLDIGCGNGRDTIFFLKKKLLAIGIDHSKSAISILKKKYKNNFYHLDACKSFKKKFKINKFDIIYARFFIHSISLRQEKFFFKNVIKFKNLNSKTFVEFRTTKDDLFKKGKNLKDNITFTDHYRRFIRIKDFKKRISSYGFKIDSILEGKNLAKYKNENPHVARIILSVDKK